MTCVYTHTHTHTHTHTSVTCKSFERGISDIKCTYKLRFCLRVCPHNIHFTDHPANIYFVDIITGYYENHMNYTNTLNGQIEESFTVKSRGAYNLCAKIG